MTVGVDIKYRYGFCQRKAMTNWQYLNLFCGLRLYRVSRDEGSGGDWQLAVGFSPARSENVRVRFCRTSPGSRV